MIKSRQHVKLSDIKCDRIVEEIKEATKVIEKFRHILNKHLKYKSLNEPQIFFVRVDSFVFEDNKSTKTLGYEYEVFWCFQYMKTEEVISIFNLTFCSPRAWPKCLLFFKLTMKERQKDHKYKDSRFFKLFLTEETDIITTEKEPFACYNGNYSLSAMLNAENLCYCIEKINEVFERVRFKQALIEECIDVVEIPNIEEYINKNSK